MESKKTFEIKNLKGTLFAIFAILILLSLPVTLPTQPVEAQPSEQQPISGELPAGANPNVTISTQARLSVRPDPIGLGQTFLVNLWTNPGTHVERKHEDYTVTITKPDGEQEVIKVDSYVADATAWFEYVADQVGNWTLKFDFLGTYYPAGYYYQGKVYPSLAAIGTYTSGAFTGPAYLESAYYKPSSTPEITLTVQAEQVMSWPPSQLPTDYWTRPISPENREWWVIGGDFPWYGPATEGVWDELYPETNRYWDSHYRFTPWVEAPDSSHIVWKQQGTTLAGIGGGDNGASAYNPESSRPDAPSIIWEGRAYHSYTKPGSGKTAVTYWKCYDIRTGELFWERPLETGESAPTVICYESADPTVLGGGYKASLSASLVYIGGGRMIKYNPMTGAMSLNASISPLTTGTYYMNSYALSIQNIGNTTNPNYRLINWTTRGTATTLAARIISNTSYARSSLPTLIDYSVGLGATISGITIAGTYAGINVTGYDLLTGATLWSKTTDDPLFSGTSMVADHGKVATVSMKGYWLAWDLRTGDLAWKTEELDYPWDASGWGVYGVQSAYGNIYWEGYMALYAIDWDTGKINWRYYDPSVPFETPYSGYTSLRSNALIADGKIYLCNDEHSPTNPLTRGWNLHCVNATSGEGIWNIVGSMRPSAIADGYLAGASMYDGYLYWFGKGKSATTVSAPQTVIPQGQSIVITGTVLDQSPAQLGAACVSKESMTTLMEYLHMQKPIDGIWHNETITGVPVSLDTVDPNGNYIHIGDVVTDGYSGTFGYTWEPEVSGQYTVTATFLGDDSYGSSFATTYVGVTEAEAASPTSSPITFDVVSNTIMTGLVVVGVAIIIAIAIAVVLLLRKKP
ncbi:MAG: PQQ-binding-like beta-propeller repeat protein [Candidatus Bathyarchaeia archaeon]